MNRSSKPVLNSQCYCVCAIPRSGSTLLCAALTDTGVAGNPDEYFLSGITTKKIRNLRDISWLNRAKFELRAIRKKSYNALRKCPGLMHDYSRALVRSESTHGVFGFKLHWNQWCEHFSEQPPEHYFGPLRYVSIRRRDHILQAVSWVLAEQTMRWFDWQPNKQEPFYDFPQLLRTHASIVENERSWDEFFDSRGIKPLRIIYEDLISDYENTVKQVLSHIGVQEYHDIAITAPNVGQQSDERNSLWAMQYVEDLKKLASRAETREAMPDVRHLMKAV